MRKFVALTVLLLFVSTASFAAGFGIGWSNGISVLAPGIAGPVTLQGVINFNNWSPGNENLDSTTTVGLTGYGLYPIINIGEAKLCLFGGVSLKSVTDNDMGFGIKFGLAPSVMVTDNLCLSGKAGLGYTQQPVVEGGDADSDIGSVGGVAIHWMF